MSSAGIEHERPLRPLFPKHAILPVHPFPTQWLMSARNAVFFPTVNCPEGLNTAPVANDGGWCPSTAVQSFDGCHMDVSAMSMNDTKEKLVLVSAAPCIPTPRIRSLA